MADRTIFKYPIDVARRQLVSMPAGARILTAQPQGSQLCLWAIVTPGNVNEERVIWIVGTGHPMPSEPLRHIATAQQPTEQLVWHVFEVETG